MRAPSAETGARLTLCLGLGEPSHSHRPIPHVVKLQLISRLNPDHRGEVPNLHVGCK